MSAPHGPEDSRSGDDGPRPAEDPLVGDEDLGEPIEELRDLREEVSAGFWGRLAATVQRRSLAGQLATLLGRAWAQAGLEFMAFLFSYLQPDATRDKDGGNHG